MTGSVKRVPESLGVPGMSVISSDEDDDVTIPKQCMSREAMQKLYEMRLNNQLCDAKLSMEDGSIFNVHRAILCACSSYFR